MQRQAAALQQEADEAKEAAAVLNARLEEGRKRAGPDGEGDR